MPISWLDAILILIMVISGFLAMLRGLTREVLSIMSWAMAAVATLYIWPQYKDEVRQYTDPPIIAEVALAAAIFIVVLIVVSLITMRLSDRVLDSRVGALDRSLGFVFGLARGLILVVIAYLFFSWLVPKENQPKWILEARSLPIIEQTGNVIVSLLPENPADVIPKSLEGGVLQDKKSSLKSPTILANFGKNGYAVVERREMKQSLESVSASRN